MDAKTLLAGAVDIGGTKVAVGLVDESGRVLVKSSFPTPVVEGAQYCIDTIAAMLNKQLAEENLRMKDLQGIGIGCAGPVDVEKGKIQNPYTLPGWEGYPFTEQLTKQTGLPVVIENDVNTAVLGEVLLHNLKDRQVLMITFGTGIGVAVYGNDGLYMAKDGFHPEMGHMLIERYGPPCYCGNRGCFESLWSGNALNKRAEEEGYNDFDQLFKAYQAGTFKAVDFITTALYQLKAGLWNLMTVFRPEVVILGGGIMKQYFFFVKEALLELLPKSPDFIGDYILQAAESQNDSTLVGAAGLILGGRKE